MFQNFRIGLANFLKVMNSTKNDINSTDQRNING